MPAFKIKVTVKGTNPPVYRLLSVPKCFTFAELMQAMDASLGRTIAMRREVLIPSEGIVIRDHDLEIPCRLRVLDASEPIAPHKTSDMLYTPDPEGIWVHAVRFAGSDGSCDLPHPRLIKASGPSPGDGFLSPAEFREAMAALRDPRHPLNALSGGSPEALGLIGPDAAGIGRLLEEIVPGSGNAYYMRHGSESSVHGRPWNEGPPSMPGAGFFADMDRLPSDGPSDAPYEPCPVEWPAYSDLSPAQTAWFLRWRRDCLDGRVSHTDRGYIWLLAAEVYDSGDTELSGTVLAPLAEACRAAGDEAAGDLAGFVSYIHPLSLGRYPSWIPVEDAAFFPGSAEAFYAQGSPSYRAEDAQAILDIALSGYDAGIGPEDYLAMCNHVLSEVHRACPDIPEAVLPGAPRSISEYLAPFPVRSVRAAKPIDCDDLRIINTSMLLAVPITLGTLVLGDDGAVPLLPEGLRDLARSSMEGWLDAHPHVRDGMHPPEWRYPFSPDGFRPLTEVHRRQSRMRERETP